MFTMNNIRQIANKYGTPDQAWLSDQKLYFTQKALGQSFNSKNNTIWSQLAHLKMSYEISLITLRRFHLMPVLSFGMVAAVLLLAIFPAVRSATKLVLPTSPLYVAKLAAERAQTAITFSTNGEAILHLDLAGSRLDELQSLSFENNSEAKEQVIKVARQYTSEVQTVKNRLEILTQERKNGSSVSITMAKLLLDKSLSYRQTLEALQNKDQSIVDAIKETQAAVDSATTVLLDAHDLQTEGVTEADVKKAVETKVNQVETDINNSAATDFASDLNMVKQDLKAGEYSSAFNKATDLEAKLPEATSTVTPSVTVPTQQNPLSGSSTTP